MTWALSIIGLTLVVRAALIPLFVKQIKSSRNMQLLQPRVKELQKKYGHDRERLSRETMNLYRETKTNPFASCLPLIIQIPIFIALFRLLDTAAKEGKGHGVLTNELARSFADAPIFGGTLSDSFVHDGGSTSIKVVAAFLVVIMVSTTFLTQRQLMSKNMPADALSGPYAQQQKMLLYILPFTFVLSGPFFPIGVIMYWTTSNIWTMGQQFYVIRNNPAPNTEAFRAKLARDTEKRQRKGLPEPGATGAAGRGRASRSHPRRRRASSRRSSRGPSARSRDPAPNLTSSSASGASPRPMRESKHHDRAAPGRHRDRDPGGERRGRGDEETAATPEAEADADSRPSRRERLESEGEIAADYLEELLEITDLDGDLDMDVEGDRATVSIVGAALPQLVGDDGEVLEALQELTRLAVYRQTGERSRLMLDVSGHRANRKVALEELAAGIVEQVRTSGESAALEPMSPFERKVVHDVVAAAGLVSESEGTEPRRHVVVLPG